MAEKIMTRHPQGKQGVNIDRDKYDAIKSAILETIDTKQTVTFKDLTTTVNDRLRSTFDGGVTWYVVTVKLDLEAQGLIERVPKSSPQILRLTRKHD
ncbi:MAG: hypothetical protein R3F48_12010 [Candidatus Zixiibacteriota bacterium]